MDNGATVVFARDVFGCEHGHHAMCCQDGRAVNAIANEFAMDRLGIGIHWLEFETGKILYANPAAAKMLDYTVEELLGKTVSDIDPNFPLTVFQSVAGKIRDQQAASGKEIEGCAGG